MRLIRESPLGRVTRGKVPRSNSSERMVELPGRLASVNYKGQRRHTFCLLLHSTQRLLRALVRIVLVDAQVNILWAQQINQLKHLLTPRSRRQRSFLFVDGSRDEDLLIMYVCAARRVVGEGTLAKLIVVGRPMCIRGEEGAHEEDEEEADVGYGEEGVVDEA